MPLPMQSSTNEGITGSAFADRSQTAADQTAGKVAETDVSKDAHAGTAKSTDATSEADRKYEEAIEEEYAKREGGA